MTDESVQRAAKLLLNGAIMLHVICPECKDPIYKLRDGGHLCATCNKQVIFQPEDQVGNVQESSNQTKKIDPIQNKINRLSEQLELESDPDEILKLANLIKKLQAL
ncbi:MAG: Sjogren's syndrome/scleroderma autoantigen 1 family protein [Candidatus Kariarchaeaceae archaeon]|jgi:UPF0148 protein